MMRKKKNLPLFPEEKVRTDLNESGYSHIENFLSESECNLIKSLYESDHLYRKTVDMSRYRFGSGEYKYFNYPLPEFIQEIREKVYPWLVPTANSWMEKLNKKIIFPDSLAALRERCEQEGQNLPTVLLLKYQVGGFNTLHQDLYGSVYFPFQLVIFLSEPNEDYLGGEFVLTETVPRAQTKAIVLKPKKGDMLVITTNFRPKLGQKGYYKINVKHGVSIVSSGERFTLGIIFHDAMK